MSDVRKAAILLMTLPEDEAALLLAKLDPKEVEAVSIQIAKLGRLSADEQEEVIVEFGDSNPNALISSSGSLDLASKLVARAMGEDASDTLDSVKQSIEAMPFGFLKKVDPQNLMTFILDEHPQTIALILSHLPPAYGAEIIAGLEQEIQVQVVSRIAKMGQTNPEVIQEVEKGLSARMATVVGQSFDQAGGIPNVAEMLNVADRSVERQILDSMGEEDPELVEEIRRLMFVFEDIGKFGDKDIQTLLKNIETSQWAMALKGSSEALREKILGNMSKRAAEMLTEEMEYLGPVRLSDVEAVQQQVVETVRMLEEQGQITVASGAAEDEFVA